MATAFINILVVVLAAAFAIGSIIGIFTLASWVFHAIWMQFQRSVLRGVGAIGLTLLGLAAVVFIADLAAPFLTEIYRQIMA
ncbi:MAG: hypothetical protein P4L10_06475 [Acidobacteriaceae bacterium]|jgi:hypothetical protein|nr:hypothetical protein [Acidobacteriaceae bacterium]